MRDTPRHIGIVAVTSEGAALAYRAICREAVDFLGEYRHPEVTLHGHSFSKYKDFTDDASRLQCWEELILQSANIVAKSGAEFFICPANTNHEVYREVVAKSPIPWLHIAEVVAAEMNRIGCTNAGLLGTKYLMEGSVYRDIFESESMGYITPHPQECDEVHRIIYDELIMGVINPDSKSILTEIIDSLHSRGCDSIILGCTELPLILAQGDHELPFLDSTRILARGAVAYSLSD